MQPKPDFPSMQSSVHNQAIILTRLDPETPGKFFLCAQDIIDGVAGDKSTLQTYEEFCNYLSQPNIMPSIDEEQQKEKKELVEKKKVNLMKFQRQIEEEKQVVKRLVNDKLQELYKSKCNQLSLRLQNQLDDQYKLFQENYDKLGVEIMADREKEAGLDKYEEIKKKVKEMNDPIQVEDYLKSTYRTKMAWKTACSSLQNLGSQSENFYKELIEKQLINTPELSDVDRMVETWVSGLERLVGQVKADEGIFKNMLCACGLVVPLEIDVKEIKLIRNEMLKHDTQLIIKAKETINEEQMLTVVQELEKLSNLVHFVFDAGELKLPLGCLKLLVRAFKKLEKLQSVQIKAFGAKIGDQGMQELVQLLPLIPNVKELKLELGLNGITNKGLTALASQLPLLTSLQCFALNLQCNQIKGSGLEQFCQSLEYIIPQIVCLNLNFGGLVLSSNKLGSAGASALIKCLNKAQALKYLCLDFDNNIIDTLFIRELVKILPLLSQLFDLTLNLNNNKLDTNSAKKLAKFLKSRKYCKLVLNLSGNDIKAEGVDELISAITTMELLFKIKLNVRNSGIKRGLATQMKIDLEKKQGRQFEEIEFLA